MKTVLQTSEIDLYIMDSATFFNDDIKHDLGSAELNLYKRNKQTELYRYFTKNKEYENRIFIKLGFGVLYIYIPDYFTEKFNDTELTFLIRKTEMFSIVINDLQEMDNNCLDLITDELTMMTYDSKEYINVMKNVFIPIKNILKDGCYSDEWEDHLSYRLTSIKVNQYIY